MIIYDVPWIPRYVPAHDALQVLAAAVSHHVDRAWLVVRAAARRS